MQHPKYHNKNLSMKSKQQVNKIDTQGTNNTHFEQKHKEQKRHCQSFNISFLQPLRGAHCLLRQKCVRDSTDVAVLSDSTIANMLRMGKAHHELPPNVLALVFLSLALHT